MPNTKTFADKPAKTNGVCDLCGLALRAEWIEGAFAGRTHHFCCTGCRQVFSILLQAAGSADPAAFRRSDLFRKCQESGLIPRSADDPPLPAPFPETASAPTSPPPAAGLTLALKVENMWCPACAWLIETALARAAGVLSAACSFATDQLRVRYDPVATDPDRIIAVVQRFGYGVSLPGDIRDQGLRRREWTRFGISAFLTMNVMMPDSPYAAGQATRANPPIMFPLIT